MGSLEGHLLPGTFILGFGLWWTYALFDRYFKVISHSIVTKKRIRFHCTASYSHIEGFVKVIGGVLGMSAEFVTALEDFHFTHIGNSQHITMYLFFLINGIVDLLLFYGFPLPKDSDYMTLLMAAAIEALLFCFHLHGRTALDIHVHTLLIIAVIASIVSGVVEMTHRHNVLATFGRTLCALLQGSWFYTSLFCWQIAAIFVFMCFIGFCFYCKYRPILLSNDFSENKHSFGSYSDFDYKSLINESKLNQSNQLFGRTLKSNNSLVCTSDEDI